MPRLTLCIVLLFVSVKVVAKGCETPLVVSFSGDWAPYFYTYGTDKYDGTDYELLVDVMESLGCRVAVLPMTEARSIIELRKGSYDVSLGASYTQERHQNFHFSSAYREEQIGKVIISGNGQSSDTTLREILEAGGIVGINMSGYFGDTVEALKAQFKAQFVHGFSLSERIRMVTQRTIDAVVDDRIALCIRLRNNPSLMASQEEKDKREGKVLVLTDEILHRDNIHFMFSKHTVDSDFVTRFNTELSTLAQQPPAPGGCSVTD